MIVRIHNNDSTDYCDYEADTIEEIRIMCANRIKLPTWDKGWSEIIEETKYDNH
jgi:hypothetical protein